MLQRFDVGTLGNVEKTPQGGLRVAALLTRAGVFHYDDGKGGSIAEYRPLDEVSHADSLATLPDAPVTVGHPGMVTPDNHSSTANGHARDVKMDGDRVGATLVIQGRKAIKAVEKGVRQISCGYTCRVDEVKGTAPDGTPYDRVQRGIRYNHVALVDKGRAGDDIRLRLDAAGNQQPTREDNMEFERIDGVKYEVGTEAHTAAAKQRDKNEAERVKKFDELKAEVAKQSTLAETAKADKAKLETEIAALKDPARLDAAVTARASLVESAKLVLGAEAKFDGKLDLDIKREVVAKAYPSLKFDAKDSIRIETAFETAMANASESAEKVRADAAAVGATRAAIVSASKTEAASDPDKARADMIARNSNAWKTPANGAAK